MLRHASIFFGLLITVLLCSPVNAQKVGDRRIFERSDGYDCQIYSNVEIDFRGNRRLMWSPRMLTHDDFVKACANAINLKQYLDSRPIVTEDGVDHLVSAIREKRGFLHRGKFTHGCGIDGLLYDIFPDGSVALHVQSLRNPNRRCRINPKPRQYRGSVADVIGSVGGEIPAANPRPYESSVDQNDIMSLPMNGTASRKFLLSDISAMDTYTRSSLPELSWGSEFSVIVGGWGDIYNGFVQFDVTELPPLESNQRLFLKLYNKARSTGTAKPAPMRVQRLETAVSNETTWNSRILTNDAFEKDFHNVNYNAWLSIDITEHYRAWKAGAVNYGIALLPLDENNSFNFFVASEANNDPSLLPHIEFR